MNDEKEFEEIEEGQLPEPNKELSSPQELEDDQLPQLPEVAYNPKPTYHPIACPHCKSKNLAYVTEYHKCIGAYILQMFFLLCVGLGIFEYFKRAAELGLGVAVICLIFMFVTQIYIFVNESRTHVQCVCKDCGHTWLHT